MDPLFLPWLGGVVRRFRALRVARHPTLCGQRREVVGPVPIAAPLPDVSSHVVKPVTVRRELRDGSDAGETVITRVFHWELSLVNVRHPFTARFEFIAPGIEFA